VSRGGTKRRGKKMIWQGKGKSGNVVMATWLRDACSAVEGREERKGEKVREKKIAAGYGRSKELLSGWGG